MSSSTLDWRAHLDPELQLRLAAGWQLLAAVESEHAIYLWRREQVRHAPGVVHRLLTGAKLTHLVTIRMRVSDEQQVVVELVV